jgi:hypothetical protein
MNTIVAHTPTPWLVFPDFPYRNDGGRIIIATPKQKDGEPWGTEVVNSRWGVTSPADAAFIVKAVNNHELLVAALKDAIEALSWYAEEKHQVAINALDAARDALSSATAK